MKEDSLKELLASDLIREINDGALKTIGLDRSDFDSIIDRLSEVELGMEKTSQSLIKRSLNKRSISSDSAINFLEVTRGLLHEAVIDLKILLALRNNGINK